MGPFVIPKLVIGATDVRVDLGKWPPRCRDPSGPPRGFLGGVKGKSMAADSQHESPTTRTDACLMSREINVFENYFAFITVQQFQKRRQIFRQ